MDDADYGAHIKRKEEARQEKAKNKSNNDIVFCVDLQAVLNALGN